MMMKKLFTVIFLLFSFSLVNAQFSYQKCKVVYKNGKSRTGYVLNELNRKNENYIWFKENSERRTDAEHVNNPELSKLIFWDSENNEVEFERILTSTGGRNKIKIAKDSGWAQVLVKGICTLYHHSSVMTAGNPLKGGGGATFHDYFAFRKGEPAARQISVTASANNNQAFRILAPIYFADYPELAEKIETKEYTWRDIIDVVIEYNKWADSKKK
jgi:hypothetical protein